MISPGPTCSAMRPSKDGAARPRFTTGAASAARASTQAGSGIYAQRPARARRRMPSRRARYNVVDRRQRHRGTGNQFRVHAGGRDDELHTGVPHRGFDSTGSQVPPGLPLLFRCELHGSESHHQRVHQCARAGARKLRRRQAALIGPTAPNWQSTNASLTYNNGITCNCNVTGADWNVGTASIWTPTRNYAITFRVPNAYCELRDDGAVDARFHPGKHGGESEQDLRRRRGLEPGAGEPQRSEARCARRQRQSHRVRQSDRRRQPHRRRAARYADQRHAHGRELRVVCSSTTTNVQDAGSPCPALFTKYSMGTWSAARRPARRTPSTCR